MRTLPLILAVLAVVAFSSAAFAQDIYGLSFRPTDAAPEGAARGRVDITSDGAGAYMVDVDLSAAAEALTLDSFDGAAAFVVWAVDMEGARHNVGTLDDELMLTGAKVEFLIAKLFLTAEASGDAEEPAGDRLYEVRLRDVAEQEGTSGKPSGEESAVQQAATTTTEPTMAPKPAATVAAAGRAATAAPATAAPGGYPGTTEKPATLPSSGSDARDLLLLALVAAVLVAGALRIRSVRL